LALERLARATGGQERLDLASIWQEFPRQPRPVEVGHWLLLAAVVFLLLEVLERRTGVVALLRDGLVRTWARRRRKADETRARPQTRQLPEAVRPAVPVLSPAPSSEPAPAPEPQPPPTKPPAPAPPAGGLFDALRQARRRTRDRVDRNDS
jgi:hypothetical protein